MKKIKHFPSLPIEKQRKILKEMIGERACLNPESIRLYESPPGGYPAKLIEVRNKYACLEYDREFYGYKVWEFRIDQIVPYREGMEKAALENMPELGKLFNQVIAKS